MKDLDIFGREKLRLVLKSPKQTIGYDWVIGAGNIYDMLTYVDFSYGIHNDTIGHTDGCMMFGWGLIHKKLSKQKLNTQNST